MGCGNSNDAATKDGDKKRFEEKDGNLILQLPQTVLNSMMPFYWVNNSPTGTDTNNNVNRATAYYTRQSLERDGYTKSSCTVAPSGDDVVLTLVQGSGENLATFATQLSKFYEYGQLGLDAYNAIVKETGVSTEGITFSLELGLTNVNQKSLMLLHYPPDSTKDWSDFLYAPTISRWNVLLAQNGVSNADITLQQRIVDILPLVASSLAGAEGNLKPFEGKSQWEPYVDKSIDQFLSVNLASGAKQARPTVIFGGETKSYIYNKYKDQVDAQLGHYPQNNDVVNLTGVLAAPNDKVLCPMIFADHPSAFLYDTDTPYADRNTDSSGYGTPISKVVNGLIAAEWNRLMANDNQMDPKEAMTQAQSKWGTGDSPVIDQAFIEQCVEFWPCNENKVQDAAHATIVDETETHRAPSGNAEIDNWVTKRMDMTQSELNTQLAFYHTGSTDEEKDKNVRIAAQVIAMKVVNKDSLSGFSTFIPDVPNGTPGVMNLKFTNPNNSVSVENWVSTCTEKYNNNQYQLQYWSSQDLPGSVFDYVLPPAAMVEAEAKKKKEEEPKKEDEAQAPPAKEEEKKEDEAAPAKEEAEEPKKEEEPAAEEKKPAEEEEEKKPAEDEEPKKEEE